MATIAKTLTPGEQWLAQRWLRGPRRDLLGRPPGWAALDIETPPTIGIEAIDPMTARRINELVPVAASPGAAAEPFHLTATGAERDRALLCLTQAIYYEAALEPDAGQAAVAQTVLNRVRHPAFPHTICGVVYQGSQVAPGCQFSFTCNGSRDRPPVPWLWRRARAVAERAVAGYVMASIGSATAYHADYVFPSWGPTLVKIGQIGAHIFYRFPGPAGQPEALRQAYSGDELRVSMAGPAPVVTLASNVVTPPGQYFYVMPKAERPHAPGPGDVVGGRRLPTRDEIARINAVLLEMEKATSKPAAGETLATP